MDKPSTSGFKRPIPLNSNNNNNKKCNAVIDSDNEMEDDFKPSNTLEDLSDNDSGEDIESQSDETTFVVTHELHEGLVHSIS
jgi:hypothetical protein